MGGLSKRTTILDNERATRPVVVVDGGDFGAKSATIPEPVLGQHRLKAKLQLEAMKLAGLDAITLGDADFALGLDWLTKEATRLDLPLVSANLRCTGLEMPAFRVVERGDIKVGITAVTAPEFQGPCTTGPVVSSVKKAVQAMGPVDLVVLLSHQEGTDDAALVQAAPEIDAVVNGHSRLHQDPPKGLPGRAIQLASGSRGKYVGLARITLVAGADGFAPLGDPAALEEQKKRYADRVDKAKKDLQALAKDAPERDRKRIETQITFYEKKIADVAVELEAFLKAPSGKVHGLTNALAGLGSAVPDEPKTRALVDATLAEVSRIESDGAGAEALTDSPFVGSDACKSCHTAQFEQWTTTPHAHAMASLQATHRERDGACFSCHATGALHPKGPQFPNQMTAAYDNVQCEACHGPGKDHVAAPAKGQMNPASDVSTCTTCHDGDRDEGRFDAATYVPKVTH